MRTFLLKLSLLISSAHHYIFFSTTFCLGTFNALNSLSFHFIHTFDLLVSSQYIWWTLSINCFFVCFLIFSQHFFFHAFCIKIIWIFFPLGDVQSQSFYLDEWLVERREEKNTTHEWIDFEEESEEEKKPECACVVARFECGMCKCYNKRLTKRNNHNECPFEPKNIFFAPTTNNFICVLYSWDFMSVEFPHFSVKVIVNFIISAYNKQRNFRLNSGFSICIARLTYSNWNLSRMIFSTEILFISFIFWCLKSSLFWNKRKRKRSYCVLRQKDWQIFKLINLPKRRLIIKCSVQESKCLGEEMKYFVVIEYAGKINGSTKMFSAYVCFFRLWFSYRRP